MTTQALEADPANVIRLSDYRARPPAPAAWQTDIEYCCLYAEKLKTSHEAERAEIRLACKERGIRYWWEGPQDIRDRVDANNIDWQLYRAMLRHLAAMPAENRSRAQMKRATIGNVWLRGDSEYSAELRAGCEADDHLFPKSLKLARGK
jgi:hypothetical protein